MSEIVRVQQVVIGANGVIHRSPGALRRQAFQKANGGKTWARPGLAPVVPRMKRYRIIEFDNDYRCVSGSEFLDFEGMPAAEAYCKEMSWGGLSYLVDRSYVPTPNMSETE